jgi:hypothetical protein
MHLHAVALLQHGRPALRVCAQLAAISGAAAAPAIFEM